VHDPELDRHELEDDRGDYVRRPEDSWQFSLSCCSHPSQNEPHFGASLAAIQRILLLPRKRFCRLLCARAVTGGRLHVEMMRMRSAASEELIVPKNYAADGVRTTRARTSEAGKKGAGTTTEVARP